MIAAFYIGLSMLFLKMGALIAGLIPVIIIEALLIRNLLVLSPWKAVRGVAGANLLSALAGIPLICAGEIFPQFLIRFSSFSPGTFQFHWMMPLTCALLLVPSYFLSVRLEQPVCQQSWTHLQPHVVSAAVIRANRLSYMALLIVALAWLDWELISHAHL